jgi:glycosyltransferase involved in cell wall biosynthesis
MTEFEVTVVMAARNSGDTLHEACASILDQSFTSLELVVVDDFSTDNTAAVARKLIAQDSRVRCISNNRQMGRAISRNRAILSTTSNFLAIADADDISLAVRLETQVAMMAGDPLLAVVGGQVADFGPWGGPKQTVAYPLSDADIRRRFDRGHNAIPHQACMIRRAVLAEAGVYEPALLRCQDLELFLRLRDYGKMENSPDVLVNYRTDGRAPSLTYFRENARFRAAANHIYRSKRLSGTRASIQMRAASYAEIPRWLRSSLRRRQGVQYLR